MAESVARVKILAQVEGLEGFDKLKGAFRGLQQAIGPADSDLAKARKQILEFGKAGAQTEQVLKGQVEALKALQAQATIGGTVYRQLGKDVKALGGAYKEAASGVKEFTDAQLKSQIVGSKPSTFDKQIAALRRGLQDLSVYGRQYTEALTEIQRRQLPFNAALGRQNVIAGFEAYQQGPKGGSALPALPDTTAGLNQRLGELNAELVNLIRGGTDWIRVSREIANVQRRLNQEFANPAVEAARRRLEASRNTSSGFLAFSQGLEDRLAIDKSIARNQRKRDAEAAARSGAMQGPPAPSELFQGIAGIGNATAANQLQLMGRSYNEVATSIRRVSAASDGSINSLQAQRASWEGLRNAVGNNKAAYREISAEIAKVDRQLERRGMGGNRGGAAQIGQGAGALAASGIFGGPEGFLGSAGGAAIGAIMGGPAGFATGAFLGGSVGAYAGMARQGLAGMATYAADIQKQEIALKGITKTQQEYARALAASAAVTRDFNVPQLEATRGLTQLSAAVIGAGGKVADAEVVFRNVTAAIKASGGTSEDVQGALTALGQIFSKGKVSAEELQGQLGERLPGAVTMFAKATGRTLPQLQKDLEQGVVGLADLMKFVVSEQGLGQFEGRAKAVAGSAAEANARLVVSFNETKRAIGDALLPITAQIQNSLAQALRDATPALVEFAKALGGAVKILVDNAGVIAGVLKTMLGFAAVAGAAVGVVKLAGAISAVTTAVGKAMLAVELLGGGMSVATLAARGLGVAIASIPGIGWIAAGVTALSLLTVELYNNDKTFRSWVDNIGTVIATDFSNSMKDLGDRAQKAIDYVKGLLPDLEDKSKKSAENMDGSFSQAFKSISDNANSYFGSIRDALIKWWNGLPAPLRGLLAHQFGGNAAVAIVGYGVGASKRATAMNPADMGRYAAPEVQRQFKSDLETPGELTKWDQQQQSKEDKERKSAQKLADERQRLAEATAQAQIRLAEQVFNAELEFDRKRFDLQQELIDKERELRIAALTGAAADAASSTARFFKQIDDLRRRSVEASQGVSQSALKLRNTQFMQSVTGGSAGFSTQQLSAATSAAAKFTGVANMCAESVKAFYKSLGISLPGVTAWADTVRNAGQVMRDWSKLQPGDIVATGRPGDTPHVGVYTGGNNVFHQSRSRGLAAGNFPDLDYFKQNGYFVRPNAGGAQQRRNMADQADTAIAQVDFDTAVKYKDLLADMVQKRLPQEVQLFALEGAKAYKEQTQALQDNVAELQLRQRLEMSGARAEVIDSELKKAQITRDYTRNLDELKYQLQSKEALEDPVKAEGIRARIQATTQAYNEQTRAVDELTRSQIAFNDAMRFRQDTNIGAGLREGAQQYVESIGTMREATAQLAQNGIKGVEDAIFSLVTTGTANFQQFAVEILQQTSRMIIQQLILRTIMQAIGAIGGGGGSMFTPNFSAMEFVANGNAFGQNGIIPFASGGIVNKPTLFKFANGGTMGTGVMGEAGPEAIIPLRRGRDGKLGVAGGGSSTVVNVSVDASGSQVQGDADKGEQLGRAVAQAVQAELVKQKRPGGLLAA